MVVIEGMDNSGKTTLAQNLLEHFQLPPECYIHSPGPDNPFRMASRILEMTNCSNLPLLWDRIHCISDQVYSEVLGRPNWFNGPTPELENPAVIGYYPPEVAERRKAFTYCFESWIHFLGIRPTVIYCRPPIEKILNFGDREQMSGVKDKAAILVLAYDSFMSKLRGIYDVNLVRYDWTDPTSFTGVFKALNFRIREHEFSGDVQKAVQISKELTTSGFFSTEPKNDWSVNN